MRKRKGATHRTFDVLEKAAARLGFVGPTAIAGVLGFSAAVVNNWRTRGVPEPQKVLVSAAFQIPIEELEPSGLDDLDRSHLEKHNAKTAFADAIQAERDADPYALIKSGLEALVIVGKEQEAILDEVRRLAEKSDAIKKAWQSRFKSETGK